MALNGSAPPPSRPGHGPGNDAGRRVAGPDWPVLRQIAQGAAARAYAPYSGLKVGAAGLVDDGRTVSGCNVENASLGVTLCAECGLVSALAASGGGMLVALSIVTPDGRPLAPCGRCRQLLFEHGGPELVLDSGRGAVPRRLGELLPDAFGPAELRSRAAAPPGQP